MGQQLATPTKKTEPTSSSHAPKQPSVRSQTAGSLLQPHQSIGARITPGLFQAKLRISQPGDIYEQEADRVADQVMRMPDSALTPAKSNPAFLPVTLQKFSQYRPRLQRQRLPGDDQEEYLQAKAENSPQPSIGVDFSAQISSLRGSGQPLSQGERAFFEPRFGYDFSGVRLHTGSQAGELAREVNARAFTVGRDVVFGAGEHRPGSFEGKRLVAHELGHVAQQRLTGSILSYGTSILRKRRNQTQKYKQNVPYQVIAKLSEPVSIINKKLFPPAHEHFWKKNYSDTDVLELNIIIYEATKRLNREQVLYNLAAKVSTHCDWFESFLFIISPLIGTQIQQIAGVNVDVLRYYNHRGPNPLYSSPVGVLFPGMRFVFGYVLGFNVNRAKQQKIKSKTVPDDLEKSHKKLSVRVDPNNRGSITFSHPVSLKEALGLLWKKPPKDLNVIKPDPKENAKNGKYTRFILDLDMPLDVLLNMEFGLSNYYVLRLAYKPKSWPRKEPLSLEKSLKRFGKYLAESIPLPGTTQKEIVQMYSKVLKEFDEGKLDWRKFPFAKEYPGIPPWGKIIVWVGPTEFTPTEPKIELWQNWPTEISFYENRGFDSKKARLYSKMAQIMNSEMKYLIVDKRMNPRDAYLEYRQRSFERLKMLVDVFGGLPDNENDFTKLGIVQIAMALVGKRGGLKSSKKGRIPSAEKPRIDVPTGKTWKFDPSKDVDMRGTGKTHHDALTEAFNRTGVPREQFEITKWGKDKYGKAVPVEWQGPAGANVSMDIPEWNNVKPNGQLGEGPHQPHIGYQTPGKGAKRVRGHIFVDDVPATR